MKQAPPAKAVVTRRRFLRSIGALCAAAPAALAYMRFVEPSWLRLVHTSVPWPRGGAQLRIAHLSDLHASGVVPYSHIEAAIRLALECSPDLVCITGDFVTSGIPGWDRYEALLSTLTGDAPVVACLGNHDGGAWAARYGGAAEPTAVLRLLDGAGIDCLRDESRLVNPAGRGALRVVGLNDMWSTPVDTGRAFGAGSEPTLLLSHNPDSKALVRAHRWDLMLCGHTHGGQCVLPVLGTPFAPVRDHRYVSGLNPWKDRWIHTSPGVGNVLGMRLNCRPEVNILDLVPGTA